MVALKALANLNCLKEPSGNNTAKVFEVKDHNTYALKFRVFILQIFYCKLFSID